ncbi:MAG: menaquinone biosynthesis protein [Candidatus Brocadiales bacterium]|nr:menaquinone biosynthesis protein [Candidatus Brocadiales bacterium]
MERRLRIGVVPYLNAKPLVYGLEKRGQVELIFDLPSVLPRLLEEGGVEVALIPSIEYLRGKGYTALAGICISSKGPVESVRLFLKKPLNKLRSVALDEASLTSAALTRIILKERYGLEPRYLSWRSGPRLEGVEADAVLVIGDNAIRVSDGLPSLDLGAEWQELTQLPFVYALWVATSAERLERVSVLLQEAKESGVQDLGVIALREAEKLGLRHEVCLRYLTERIHYSLGEQEIEGLERFYSYALKMGLAPEGVRLEFSGRGHIREGAFKGAYKS